MADPVDMAALPPLDIALDIALDMADPVDMAALPPLDIALDIALDMASLMAADIPPPPPPLDIAADIIDMGGGPF
jgi:hypothetical protein